MSKTAVLIIDMQNAYFNNDALRERQKSLIDTCNRLVKLARHNEWPIVLVRTEHKKNRSTWTLNMHDDDEGYLFEGEDDVRTVDGLDVAGTKEILKTRDSAFFGTDLAVYLHQRGVSRLVLCGVSTHTCIAQSAADAYASDFHVTIVEDAVASHDPQFHSKALLMLQQEYRQAVVSIDQIEQSSTKAV